MAGLFAWAADVVGGHGKEEDETDSIPIVFNEDQLKYVRELDRKADTLSRSIYELRLRLPPPDISQRLPDLLAHSIASNAALALQLNSHSATREQAQLREEILKEENVGYEKAISNSEIKLHEKMQEADSLLKKLKEMDEIENELKEELENAQAALLTRQSGNSGDSAVETYMKTEADTYTEDIMPATLEKLENKKQELSLLEARVQDLEDKWATIQEKALKQPSSAQREKALDKQLHSLIEQLEAKQAQAEGLVGEIRLKEMELEGLNGIWRNNENNNSAARNRSGRNNSDRDRGYGSDYSSDSQYNKPSYNTGNNNTNRFMLLRPAFVVYILALHILVFLKISF